MASEDNATEAQIKHLYGVIHGLGMDPKEWKKNSNISSFAKLTRKQCSDYITELEEMEAEKKAAMQPAPAPAATTMPIKPNEKERFGDRAEAEAEKIRQEQGRGAPGEKPDVPKEAPPTVEELIFKYLDIMVKVTVAVEENKQISERQRGYTVNWVCDAVKDALNGKGGNHEGQA